MNKRKLFILIDWWKDSITRERFKYPTTVTKVEKNIEKLMKRVIESDNSDWYVPRLDNVDTKYTVGSLKKEPNVNEYSEFYIFGMSLGACVMVSPWGYCFLPKNKTFVLKECSIHEDFITNGVVTNMNEYVTYLRSHNRTFKNAELEHNIQVEREMERYAKDGAAWVHEPSYSKEPDKYLFKKEDLYDTVKFRSLDEIYSII
jgi:hypothetical protein